MKRLPLSGLRVIDLSRVVAACTCAQILGDLGAEVLKVERPGVGDEGRTFGAQAIKDADGRLTSNGSMYISANRNKKGLTIDIAKPAGQELVRQLAAKSDAFIENFKTGDLARYGLDHDSIKAVNPRIVYCSVTGFGQTGPLRNKPGYDTVFQARGGWMSVNGTEEQPMIAAANMVDTVTGYFAAMSVLAALYHRDRGDDPGGAGQAIDIALLDCAIASIAIRAQDWLLTREQPPRRDTAGNLFRCADGAVVVSLATDSRYRRLCEVLGASQLAADPRWLTRDARIRDPQVWVELERYTRTRTMAALIDALDAADVPVAPVYGFAQAFADPQVQARGMAQRVRHGSGGEIELVANPMNFSATPIDEYRAPPMLGEHTDEVLRDVLGLDAPQREALRRAGVID
jgi:crotonobetainyl-CoA:carnitine CoA-transferase CaiB-like acyl-CoA transferase